MDYLINKIKKLKPRKKYNLLIDSISLYNTTTVEELYPFMNFEENPYFQLSLIDDTTSVDDVDAEEEEAIQKIKINLRKIYDISSNLQSGLKNKIRKCCAELNDL